MGALIADGLEGETLPVALNLIAPKMRKFQILRVIGPAVRPWNAMVNRRAEGIGMNCRKIHCLTANIAVGAISFSQHLNGHIVFVEARFTPTAKPAPYALELAALASRSEVDRISASSAFSRLGSAFRVEPGELGAIG